MDDAETIDVLVGILNQHLPNSPPIVDDHPAVKRSWPRRREMTLEEYQRQAARGILGAFKRGRWVMNIMRKTGKHPKREETDRLISNIKTVADALGKLDAAQLEFIGKYKLNTGLNREVVQVRHDELLHGLETYVDNLEYLSDVMAGRGRGAPKKHDAIMTLAQCQREWRFRGLTVTGPAIKHTSSGSEEFIANGLFGLFVFDVFSVLGLEFSSAEGAHEALKKGEQLFNKDGSERPAKPHSRLLGEFPYFSG